VSHRPEAWIPRVAHRVTRAARTRGSERAVAARAPILVRLSQSQSPPPRASPTSLRQPLPQLDWPSSAPGMPGLTRPLAVTAPHANEPLAQGARARRHTPAQWDSPFQLAQGLCRRPGFKPTERNIPFHPNIRPCLPQRARTRSSKVYANTSTFGKTGLPSPLPWAGCSPLLHHPRHQPQVDFAFTIYQSLTIPRVFTWSSESDLNLEGKGGGVSQRAVKEYPLHNCGQAYCVRTPGNEKKAGRSASYSMTCRFLQAAPPLPPAFLQNFGDSSCSPEAQGKQS
jgi:hypothetical protein